MKDSNLISGNFSLERMDHSIKNDNDGLLGTEYYDQLLMMGDSDSILKINASLNDEYLKWNGKTGEEFEVEFVSIDLDRVAGQTS